MPSQDEHSTTGAHETGLWTSLSLIALGVFFIGCACFAFADIFLGSNDKVSAITAIVGVPLFLIGGIVLMRRCRLGPVPLPDVSDDSTADHARR